MTTGLNLLIARIVVFPIALTARTAIFFASGVGPALLAS
jgi:hypothetical protein